MFGSVLLFFLTSPINSIPFPITKIVELFVALLENSKIFSESKTPVIFILTATYTTRPTFIDILLIMDTLFGAVTSKWVLLFYIDVSSHCIRRSLTFHSQGVVIIIRIES